MPTYRHEALAAYQSGREFEAAILEQLALLPGARRVVRLRRARRAPGYEADDFLAAAAAPGGGSGPVLVATSDRDAFQLVERPGDDPAAGARA